MPSPILGNLGVWQGTKSLPAWDLHSSKETEIINYNQFVKYIVWQTIISALEKNKARKERNVGGVVREQCGAGSSGRDSLTRFYVSRCCHVSI